MLPDTAEWREMVKALAQPFETVDFLPKANSGGMALGLPYIDARDVMRRLDAVVGAEWTWDYEVLSADCKRVKGKLTVRGVTRCDAGEADREDEPLKSAVSDALKRCAVHFGIGRYLYFLPQVWAPFDAQKRRFVEKPQLKQAEVNRAVALAISDASPESGGDRQAQAEPRPAAPAAAPPAPPATQQAQRSGTATQSAQRVADRPQPGFIGGKPAEERPDPLVCTRQECGRPITRGQRDMSVKNYGGAYCPACQKIVARNGDSGAIPDSAKGPLETARDGYFAALGERLGKLDDATRYAAEAVILGHPEPLEAGAKNGWSVEDWRKYARFVRECDPHQVLDAARAMLAKRQAPSGTAFGRL